MNNKKPQAPDPVAAIDPADQQNRLDIARRKRLASGGYASTLFTDAPIVAAAPKSSLFGVV